MWKKRGAQAMCETCRFTTCVKQCVVILKRGQVGLQNAKEREATLKCEARRFAACGETRAGNPARERDISSDGGGKRCHSSVGQGHGRVVLVEDWHAWCATTSAPADFEPSGTAASQPPSASSSAAAEAPAATWGVAAMLRHDGLGRA